MPLSAPYPPDSTSSPVRGVDYERDTASNGAHSTIILPLCLPDCSVNYIADLNLLSGGCSPTVVEDTLSPHLHPHGQPTSRPSPLASPSSYSSSSSPFPSTATAYNRPTPPSAIFPTADITPDAPSSFYPTSDPTAKAKIPHRRGRNPFIHFRSYLLSPEKKDMLALPADAGQQAISKRAGELWRRLPAAEKAPFFALAERDKARLAAGEDIYADRLGDGSAEGGGLNGKRKHRRTREKSSSPRKCRSKKSTTVKLRALPRAPPPASPRMAGPSLLAVSPAVSDVSLGEATSGSEASPLGVPRTPLNAYLHPLLTITEVSRVTPGASSTASIFDLIRFFSRNPSPLPGKTESPLLAALWVHRLLQHPPFTKRGQRKLQVQVRARMICTPDSRLRPTSGSSRHRIGTLRPVLRLCTLARRCITARPPMPMLAALVFSLIRKSVGLVLPAETGRRL